MSHTIKIGLPLDFFVTWTGGVALFLEISEAMARAARYSDAELMLIATAPKDIGASLPRGTARVQCRSVQTQGPLSTFLRQTTFSDVFISKDLATVARDLHLDIVGPSGDDLGTEFPTPWCAYVYDFQHRHLPQLFTQQLRSSRDRAFGNLLANSTLGVVNAQDVVDDIRRFYSPREVRSEVYRLPVLVHRLDWDLPSESQLRSSLGIPGPYFVSCSQQWMHKQHDVIIRAFAQISQEKDAEDALLLFTGNRVDPRAPEYPQTIDRLIAELGLQERVRYLGLLDRPLQLALIRHAVALTHASLFEGGPASGTPEAASLGTPIIASDLAVNHELPYGIVDFFPPSDTAALAQLLLTHLRRPVRGRPLGDDEVEQLNLAAGIQLIQMFRRHVKRH